MTPLEKGMVAECCGAGSSYSFFFVPQGTKIIVLKRSYPEMAHSYAVILLFFFQIEFQTCLIYSDLIIICIFHEKSIKQPCTKIKTFKLISTAHNYI